MHFQTSYSEDGMPGFAAAMRLRHVLAGAVFSFSTGIAGAADLQEPITLQSRNGVLDILLGHKRASHDHGREAKAFARR
jgi:hypothetical protein